MIGTGSTGIQAAPVIAATAHLTVFPRMGRVSEQIRRDLKATGSFGRAPVSSHAFVEDLWKVARRKGIVSLTSCNLWRHLGDSNPCYRRERAVSPSDGEGAWF